MLDAAEVGDDHRQRGGHDRLVERGEQHAQQHADDGDQGLAAGEQVAVVARRCVSQLVLDDRGEPAQEGGGLLLLGGGQVVAHARAGAAADARGGGVDRVAAGGA